VIGTHPLDSANRVSLKYRTAAKTRPRQAHKMMYQEGYEKLKFSMMCLFYKCAANMEKSIETY